MEFEWVIVCVIDLNFKLFDFCCFEFVIDFFCVLSGNCWIYEVGGKGCWVGGEVGGKCFECCVLF